MQITQRYDRYARTDQGVIRIIPKNFRLTPDATLANWIFILNAGFFRNAYVYTFWLAGLTAVLASLIAFPAAYTLAFRAAPATRRFLISLIPTGFSFSTTSKTLL